jgi:hypothetical protein
MKRKARTFSIVTLLLLIAIGASSPWIVKLLVQRGLEQVRASGTNISWNGLTTGPTSIALDSLTVWVPGPKVKGVFTIPLSVELQQIAIALKLGSLLTLSPSITFTSNLYGGSLSGNAQNTGGTNQINGLMQDVQIGKHPQLSTVGVTGGTTTASFQDMHLTAQGVEGGTFSFRVRELGIPAVEAARTLLRTENFGTVDLDAEGAVTPTTVDLSSIRLSSLFGSVVGTMSALDHLSRSPAVKGSFEVSLSEQGGPALGSIPPPPPS